MINLFDPSVNFWEVNPSWKIIEPFKTLYKSDKSKDKGKSSMMMYFVAYLNDISKANPFRNLSEEEKIKQFTENFIENPKYYEENEDQITELSEMYCNIQDTPAMKSLREWNQKMIERSRFIKNTPFGPDYLDVVHTKTGEREVTVTGTWEFLDKMMVNTKKLYDDYQRIMKDLTIEEEGETTGKGGAALSASDLGEI